jgi:hypothetical protein
MQSLGKGRQPAEHDQPRFLLSFRQRQKILYHNMSAAIPGCNFSQITNLTVAGLSPQDSQIVDLAIGNPG